MSQSLSETSLLYIEPTYKVFIFDSNGVVDKIIIFHPEDSDIKPYFTSEEFDNIQKNNIPIIWSSSLTIHADDTIKTIKQKILYELNKVIEKSNEKISIPKTYLFTYLNETIDLVEVYQTITQNDKIPINKDTFVQILSNLNISAEQYDKVEVKDFYEYDDFIKAFSKEGNTNIKYENIASPIGVYFHNSLRDYKFVANPYTIIDTSSERYSIETSKSILRFDDERVLLSYGSLVDNNIYCCFYDDIIDFHFKTSKVEKEYITELYYPLLNSVSDSEITDREDIISTQVKKWQTVDSFYNLYKKTNNITELYEPSYKIPYISRGIQKIVFSLWNSSTSENSVQILPLESIFKNIHVSQLVPYISFNPRFKKETILRLYTDKISKNGKKVPFLKEYEIAKISRELKKPKTISFYVLFTKQNLPKNITNTSNIEVYIELLETGSIHVRSSHLTFPFSLKDWNTILHFSLAPVIDSLNVLLSQYGYSLFEFTGLEDKNIKIENIKYIENIKITKNISLSDINGLNTIFSIIGNKETTNTKGEFKDDISKGIILRFKRVDNFKENDEQTILITELFKKTQDTNIILNVLKENFNMNEKEANQRLTKFITEHKYELEDIRDSAGFPTIFQLNKQASFNNTLIITVDEITSLKYLDILHLYIDCILQVNLNPSLEPNELVGKKGWTFQLKKVTGFFAGQEVINEAIKSVVKPIKAIEFTDEDTGLLSDEDEDDNDEDNDLLSDEDNDSVQEENNKIFMNIEDESDDENEEKTKNVTTKNINPVEDEINEEQEQEKQQEEPENEEQVQEEEEVQEEPENEEQQEYQQEQQEESENEEQHEQEEELQEEQEENEGDEDDGEDLIYLNETDDEDSNSQKGGTLTDINLDGQPISFLERLQSREPTLFLSKKNGKYDTYSRMCESNLKRQPVILTNEEKENIDKNHPNSYTHSIEYGTQKQKYWYICPRYWCLKTNTSITEEEVKSGVCGGIIPKDATKIPSGSYVYEFNSGTKQHIDSKGNYINNVPGFLGPDSHPEGKCIPCCFKGSWDKPQQKKRREECSQKVSSVNEKDVKVNETNKERALPPPINTKKGDVFYIFNSLAYPIQQHRFGFIPLSVQKLFNMDISKLVIRSSSANIKPDTPCLVRYGVENSNTQSFLACFAEIYSYKQDLEKPPTILEMKKILCDTITIDDFMSYHNGSLVSIFKEKNSSTILTSKKMLFFENSSLWKNTFIESKTLNEKKITDFLEDRLSIEDELFTKLTYIKTVITSYNGFISYLKDPTINIDHTFLWDTITDSNPLLIKNGVNLIILQIPNDDLTDNVEIICPTASMSNKSYDFANRETVILIKQEEFYEPIYLYEEKNKMIRVTKAFIENSPVKSVIQTIKTIKSISKKYCFSQPSRPKIYHFKKNHEVEQIQRILTNNDYIIQLQLSNYQGKIIGLYVIHRSVKKTEKNGQLYEEGIYIPVYPSSAIKSPKIPIRFADEEENTIYKNYETTIHRLINIHKNTNGMVLSKPKMKVVDDGLVVGILTETNQFIQLLRPETLENTITIDGEEPLEILSSSNYLIADKTLNTIDKEDEERETTMLNISLENTFYIMFRSMVRILLGNYRNSKTVVKIQDIIDTTTLLYKEKLHELIDILKDILNEKIEFKEMDFRVAKQIIDKSTTSNQIMSIPSSDEISKTYSVTTSNGEHSLIIPKFNLISGYDNEIMYYAKISDEILRYSRIRLFLFQPKYFLSIPNQQYKINNDEFLVLLSLLTHDYFKDIRIFNTAPQIHNTEYNYAEPVSTEHYSNKISQNEINSSKLSIDDENEEDDEDNYCITTIRSVTGNWNREFSSNPKTKEIVFKNTIICSYSPIIYILQRRIGNNYRNGEITVQLIRKILWIGYSKYINEFENEILFILKKEGKVELVDKIIKKIVQFETIIFSEDYYLTNLDYWIISIELQLPIILFNSTTIKNMVEGVNWLYLSGGAIHDYIYYIRSPALFEKNEPPRFSIVVPSFKYTELKEMKDKIQDVISNTGQYTKNTIYLTDFLRNVKSNSIQDSKKKFIIKPK